MNLKSTVIGAAVSVLVALPGTSHAVPGGVDPLFPRGLPAALSAGHCAEQANRCVWDVRHPSGPGPSDGPSYIITRHRGWFVVQRISHQRAHRLIDLWCQRKNVDCGDRP